MDSKKKIIQYLIVSDDTKNQKAYHYMPALPKK
jgi:hypothetical protein